ncbi:hypothetical protein BT96DRAFT_924881, partial [Gymnopus androsaceus JB14]
AILSQHGIFREIVLEFSRAKLYDSANKIKRRKLLHYLHHSSRCRNTNSSTFSSRDIETHITHVNAQSLSPTCTK